MENGLKMHQLQIILKRRWHLLMFIRGLLIVKHYFIELNNFTFNFSAVQHAIEHCCYENLVFVQWKNLSALI